MRFVSTRGAAPVLEFADVLLEGLARDGGLYVPEAIRPVEPLDPAKASYSDVVAHVTGLTDRALINEAYATFDHPEVVPLVQVGENLWIQELWHGPTLAFKDVALQLVGRLMDAELERRSQRRTIIVATSGDTGSAAIAACIGRKNLDIAVLHPAGRVSDVQRRQMTTVDEPNVRNIAIEGTFDDCQDLVKALFADEEFRDELQLSAMNSINWGRILAQMPYYFTAAWAHPGCVVAVPTGNFGNVLAGWYARQMGAPIDSFVIGSNRNDILTRWVDTGRLTADEVVPTLSPAMDIQVSSNHERLLFELLGRDGAATADLMRRFRENGAVEAPRDPVFAAARLDDDETLRTIADIYKRYGYLVDPHTAVGIGAAERLRTDPVERVVCLSTAHPAKFPDAVEKATGIRPLLPRHMVDLLGLEEHFDVLPPDPNILKVRLGMTFSG